ncbi:MAG: response regulator [Bdellovibrionales bacterium]
MKTKSGSRKPCILLVDDEAELLDVTKEAIEPYFDQVLTANGVPQALQILRERSGEIDIVVSDFKMPRQDGLVLRNVILGEYPQIQFVMLTAYGEDARIRDAQSIGNFPVIDKPSRPDVLVDRLQQVFLAPSLGSSKEQAYLESLGDEEERAEFLELDRHEQSRKIRKFSMRNRIKIQKSSGSKKRRAKKAAA